MVFRTAPPEGAYYVLANYEPWGTTKDCRAFAQLLAREVGVAVVDGASFYEKPELGEGLVRFAFAKKLETLAVARERLESGFTKFGP